MQGVSVSVSVLTLTAISLERYYAIVHPLRLRATPSRTRLTIFTIWLISAILIVPELLAQHILLLQSYESVWNWSEFLLVLAFLSEQSGRLSSLESGQDYNVIPERFKPVRSYMTTYEAVWNVYSSLFKALLVYLHLQESFFPMVWGSLVRVGRLAVPKQSGKWPMCSSCPSSLSWTRTATYHRTLTVTCWRRASRDGPTSSRLPIRSSCFVPSTSSHWASCRSRTCALVWRCGADPCPQNNLPMTQVNTANIVIVIVVVIIVVIIIVVVASSSFRRLL